MKKQFYMSAEDFKAIIDASKPTIAIWGSGGIPFGGTPQENANRAWEQLGRKMGFKPYTVEPNGSDPQAFLAEPIGDDTKGGAQ